MNYEDIKIGVIGGDLRQLTAARGFASDGLECALFGFDTSEDSVGDAVRCDRAEDAVNEAVAVVLPVPYTVDGCCVNCPMTRTELRLDDFFALLSPGQIVYAGMCTELLYNAAREAGVILCDYMENEELNILNAVPTAEGAVATAIRELPKTLHGSDVLIAGYGRIGKLVAKSCAALGACVTVCARSAQALAWAHSFGYKTLHISGLGEGVRNSDVIFNTVPQLLFTPAVLKRTRRGALLIDLASKPGGVDFEYARQAGITVHHALSLPGKYAPVTAGDIIRQTVLNDLGARGVLR